MSIQKETVIAIEGIDIPEDIILEVNEADIPNFCMPQEAVMVETEKQRSTLNVTSDLSDVDLIVRHDGIDVGICSQPDKNVTTNSEVKFTLPFSETYKRRKTRFRRGHNIHFMHIMWGKADQLMLERQRIVRLLLTLSMVEPNRMINLTQFILFTLLRQVNADTTRLMQSTRQYFRFANKVINIISY